MVIRQETEADHPAVYALVQAAFAEAKHSDGDEADYLDRVRKTEAFLPALSLVAEEDGEIVGQIVLYRTYICHEGRKTAQLVLSPLSVRPSHMRRGVGGALIEAACGRAAALGYGAVFLCGDSAYYAKRGFVPTHQYGIYHVRDKEGRADWCMARELVPGALRELRGTIDIQ